VAWYESVKGDAESAETVGGLFSRCDSKCLESYIRVHSIFPSCRVE